MFKNSPQFIQPIDFLIAPVFIIIILFFAVIYSKRKYDAPLIRKYFTGGIILKLCGSIAIGLITQYYYGEGDAYFYHKGATSLNELCFTHKRQCIKILGSDSSYILSLGFDISNFCEACATSKFGLETSLLMMKIGGVIGFLSQNTFLGTSLILALFSFLGSWKAFKVFSELYPDLSNYLAFSFLAIPSVVVWGSGFSKESVIMGALGFLVYNTYLIFIKRKEVRFNTISFIINSYFLLKLKIYVYISLIPALLLWIIFHNFSKSMLSIKQKSLSILFVFLMVSSFSLIAYDKITSTPLFESFSKEKILYRISFLTQHYQEAVEGNTESSNFKISNFEPTLYGLLKKIPTSINNTLFRPYMWEVKKIIYLPAALESTFLFIFTLWVLFKIDIYLFCKNVFDHPLLLFCFSFCLILSFITGLTTANFGTLIRYRIPLLPFYLASLMIVNSLYSKISINRKVNLKSKTI